MSKPKHYRIQAEAGIFKNIIKKAPVKEKDITVRFSAGAEKSFDALSNERKKIWDNYMVKQVRMIDGYRQKEPERFKDVVVAYKHEAGTGEQFDVEFMFVGDPSKIEVVFTQVRLEKI